MIVALFCLCARQMEDPRRQPCERHGHVPQAREAGDVATGPCPLRRGDPKGKAAEMNQTVIAAPSVGMDHLARGGARIIAFEPPGRISVSARPSPAKMPKRVVSPSARHLHVRVTRGVRRRGRRPFAPAGQGGGPRSVRLSMLRFGLL